MIPNIYGKMYLEKYKQLATTPLSRKIHLARWNLIYKYLKFGVILDYGCGPNTFNSYAPVEYTVFGYDINPECKQSKIPEVNFNAVTFWDSLEHIHNFYNEIEKLKPDYLFISTPNLKSVKNGIIDWKHYRPQEHIYYFDIDSLIVILANLGYKILESNYIEGQLRDPDNPEAILTIVAQRDQ